MRAVVPLSLAKAALTAVQFQQLDRCEQPDQSPSVDTYCTLLQEFNLILPSTGATSVMGEVKWLFFVHHVFSHPIFSILQLL